MAVVVDSSYHDSIEAAIADVDRVRKLLNRVRVRQIGNGEHRDFLKTMALSWFRSRRPTIVPVLPPEFLEAIDAPYRVILDAAERYSTRTTFIKAAEAAKAALVAARGATLSMPSTTLQSVDVPPDFHPLASDQVMQTILFRRWEECQLCLGAGAALAATVMMGGLLEALFVARANKMTNKAPLFSAAATPIDRKTSKPLELRLWTLAPYIDVGLELNWISRSAKDVAVILRDYRNYIHPEKERTNAIVLTSDDARMFWEITKTLSRELLLLKGTN